MSNPPHNYKASGKLFVPKTEAEKAKEAKSSDALRARYHQDIHIQKLADEIHHQRMLSGPACDQCIEIAIRRLEKQKHA